MGTCGTRASSAKADPETAAGKESPVFLRQDFDEWDASDDVGAGGDLFDVSNYQIAPVGI